MKTYFNNGNQVLSAFYNGNFITKGYQNQEIVFDSNMVTLTVVPVDREGTFISDYTITFFNYGPQPYRINNNSITVKKGTLISYTINKNNHFMITKIDVVADNTKTIYETLYEKYVFTINPTPSDSTVTLTADGYTQEGNSIIVKFGTDVSWSVSKEHYVTQSGHLGVNDNITRNISLSLQTFTYTINPTPADSTVILTASGYTQSGNSIVVPYNTSVSYNVSRTGYATKTGSEIIIQDTTTSISLTKNNYTITISTTPSDATVTFNTGTISGKSCTVLYDTEVTYQISRTGYVTSQEYIKVVTQTETITAPALVKDNFTLTINPTPSNATVTFNTSGTISGNSITVPYNTTVSYTVSATGYETKTQSTTVDTNKSVSVILNTLYTFTINPTPSDSTVTLTASGFVQSGNSITVADGTTINYSVAKTSYKTQTGTYTISGADATLSIELFSNKPVLITSNSTRNLPAGTYKYICISGGGAGGYSSQVAYNRAYDRYAGGGGGSGNITAGTFTTTGESFTFTVGAGGNGNNRTSGGTSSISSATIGLVTSAAGGTVGGDFESGKGGNGYSGGGSGGHCAALGHTLYTEGASGGSNGYNGATISGNNSSGTGVRNSTGTTAGNGGQAGGYGGMPTAALGIINVSNISTDNTVFDNYANYIINRTWNSVPYPQGGGGAGGSNDGTYTTGPGGGGGAGYYNGELPTKATSTHVTSIVGGNGGAGAIIIRQI